MFRGDTAQLYATMRAAMTAAPHPRSEHLLLALCASDTEAGVLLREYGVTAVGVQRVMGKGPAAIEADRELLAAVGVDLDAVAAEAGLAALEPRSGKPPLFPLGGKRAWRGAADFRAAYEASLRLALARMERYHRPEHLLLALLAFDRGIAWLIGQCGVDRGELERAAQKRFPPPRRNAFVRAARSVTWTRRYRAITRRYLTTAGLAR